MASVAVNHWLKKKETIDIYQNPLVALWMKEKARRDPVAFCRLIQNNTKRGERLWGEGEKVVWNDDQFIGWLNEDLGVPLVVLTGERGTVFLVNYPGGEVAFAADRKMGSGITAMLERYIVMLSGFGMRSQKKSPPDQNEKREELKVED